MNRKVASEEGRSGVGASAAPDIDHFPRQRLQASLVWRKHTFSTIS